jgi:hypothetical protein
MAIVSTIALCKGSQPRRFPMKRLALLALAALTASTGCDSKDSGAIERAEPASIQVTPNTPPPSVPPKSGAGTAEIPAMGQLPPGHPPIGGAGGQVPAVPPAAGALPPGHPPMGGAAGMPAGHPPMGGAAGMPAGHPPMGGAAGMPAGHGQVARDPHSGSLMPSQGATDGHELPLLTEGMGGTGELQRGLKSLQDATHAANFEKAYRLTFTANRGMRAPAEAIGLLDAIIAAQPAHAESWRTLGYARVNNGFDVPGAMEAYNKSVELDPNYAEAHYALAFMHAIQDKDAGAEHYRKAMELGVTDERGIGARYYPDVVVPAK